MALTAQGKKGLTRIGIFSAIVVIAILVIANWGTITAKISILTKHVGTVKTIQQSSAETEQNVNAKVLENADSKLPFAELPTTRRVVGAPMTLTHAGIMWNAGAAFAGGNGGEYTKQGSYFDKLGQEYGTKFLLRETRQDDYSSQQDMLALFTKEYLSSKGKSTNVDGGAAFVSFMGDNSEIYLQQTNKKLDAVAKDYGYKPGQIYAEGFTIAGYSYGEDKAMGLKAWKDDPSKALGQVFVVCYLDGDQNDILKWCADNGLLVNPDGSTYCYEAVNFSFTDNFMASANAWGTMTAERPVVKIDPKTGKTVKTGEMHSERILGVGTWTPGDVTVFDNANKKGIDMVSLYSTKDLAYQMPFYIVTINKFIDDHPDVIDAIVEGTARYGDQMKVHQKAFDYAMQCMADVYKEHPAEYWGKYFPGVQAKTVHGYDIQLGGSRACNLADVMDAFGVGDKSRNTFRSSYELFGGYIHDLYPNAMPNRLPYEKAVYTMSVERVFAKMSKTNEVTAAKETKYNEGSIQKVAQRSYAIEFEVGKATLTHAGTVAMETMFKDLNTHSLRLTLGGHTDNTGTDAKNGPLSFARANTVANWLKHKNPAAFPDNRFVEIKGYGSTKPLPGLDPNSKEGRDRNRRVEITVGY